MPIMKPIININGATRESHVESRIDAMRSIRKAFAAMAEIRPHGRDYLGDVERYNADLTIHTERLKILNQLESDLENEALAINEGN